MTGGLRIVLVSGGGGVLLDLLALRPWWQRHDTTWVATRGADTLVALDGLPVTWLPEPAGWPQGVPALVRAVRQLRRDRPDLVVSAGHRLAVPFFVAARLCGVRTVWVETLTQTTDPAGSARLCTRLAHAVLVRRPDRAAGRSGAVLVGDLI